jgi:hypothetical protein
VLDRAPLRCRETGDNETGESMRDLLPAAGCLIIGDKGLLATTSHNTSVRLLPEAKFENVDLGRLRTLPEVRSQYHEWIDACRGGPVPLANFGLAAPFAEFLAVGSLATRFPGETIEFHPATGRITNQPRAAEFLSYEHRQGWAI